MKKIITILGLSLCIIACKKDNNNQSTIVGTWNQNYAVEKQTLPTGIFYIDTTRPKGVNTVNFKTDGNAYYANTVPVAYDTMAYTISGNTLTLTKNNTPQTDQILTLTANNLMLHYLYNYNGISQEVWINYSR